MSEPSENPTYKLTYFNLKALAEPIRLLFAYGRTEYEDIRIEREEWPELKATMPMGQMPVLEIDDQRVYQSMSISRYLGKRFGLAGENDWENLQIDMIADTINDLRSKIIVVHFEPNEEEKAKKFEVLKSETVPFYLEKFETIAGENDGHFALGKLTWVDIYFVGILDLLNGVMGIDLIADSPNLQRLVENVNSIESIKEWIEKRPQTDY